MQVLNNYGQSAKALWRTGFPLPDQVEDRPPIAENITQVLHPFYLSKPVRAKINF